MTAPRAILLVTIAACCAGCIVAISAAAGTPCLAPLVACAPERAPSSTEDPAGGQRKPRPTPIAIGLTERDPRLLVPAGPGSRAARRVVALRPRYVRVLVAWDRVQPRRDMRPNWDAPPGGCPVLVPACRSEMGLRTLLRAIKHRHEADGGWEILVVPFWTPRWAAVKHYGCQRAGALPRARMPRIGAYRHFLRSLQALGDKVGVTLANWTPWNEPNHPGFLNPQRRLCSRKSKALAPALYAKLARAAAAEMRGDQQLVIGSLAGLDAPRTYGASAQEFVYGLPRDVACLGGPFAQHVYIGEPGRRGNPPRRVDPATAGARSLIDELDSAIQSKGCQKQLWIAETGTFDRRCESMAAALTHWSQDGRVDAAFQYTFRDTDAFPVGLVSSSLRETYGSYRAWLAFAGATGIPSQPCG